MCKGVIEITQHCEGEFISTIFIRAKKDGSHRLILNLKYLNTNVEYHNFKIKTLQSAVALMRPGCHMASIDLRDAYYSVPIDITTKNT
jgi:ribosomal protein S7